MQFGIDQSVYEEYQDDSDGLPDSSAALGTRKGSTIAGNTKTVLLPVKDGGSGDSSKFFDPVAWPASAVRSFRPLVLKTGNWDPDLAHRCLGDLQQAWIQFQTPGYQNDLLLIPHQNRVHKLWQRPLQILEGILGHAGVYVPGVKGEDRIRPGSYPMMMKWLAKLYEENGQLPVKRE